MSASVTKPVIPPHKRTVIIKRYQNRKLYDTLNSTYVTLEDIGSIVRRGDDVKVVDNRSKQDLTTVTLTQIIFEEEKKNKNSLPLSTLKRIIRGGGDAIVDLVHRSTEGVQGTIHNVKEGAENILDKFKDEIKSPTEDMIRDALQKTQNLSRNIEDKIKTTVGSLAETAMMQVEIRKLRQRIHYLEKKLKVYER